MSERDWDRIEEIFGGAAELPIEARDAFLDQQCGEDTDLRWQVETLLRADRSASGFMDHAADLPDSPRVIAPLAAGERLGPYRILRPIGEGGMGTVYLAERDDSTFDRRVAVKVLRRGTESASAIERLERERQILADLDHPGIARLLDGGTTEAGLPYVVMELVEGEPIDRACGRLELSPKARVDLMLEVCEAVTAAHRRLIVHRDLKPSNILIDAAGKPKLLDFGIAKLIDGGDSTTSPSVTESWDRRLTPSHASPEQLRGERVTVATDVYLLGVVLYQLLAGRLPFRFEGHSLVEVERLVTTQTPKRPSELAPGLDTDLDAVVLKALRVDPHNRYGSVEKLSEDLRRYRSDLPVLARKGNVRYLATKFLRRHWLPISTAALFALLLAVFGLSTAIQAERIERTLSRLIAVEGFLINLFEFTEPEVAKGREFLVEDLLARGERQLEHGGIEEPGSRGLLHALFGRIALHVGKMQDATNHLEEALRIYGDLGNDPFLEAVEVRAMSDLGMARIYLDKEPAGAESLALEALDRGRRLFEGDSVALLEVLNNLTTIYCLQRKWEEAEPLSREARALVDSSGEMGSTQHAETLGMRAMILKNHAGRPDEAERLYGQALEIYRKIEGEVHPEIATALNQLGIIARDRGDFEVATARLGEALDVQRVVYPKGHWEIARSQYQLGMIHFRSGDLEKAEEFMYRAWRYYMDDPDRGPSKGRTIFYWLHLAEIRLGLGRIEEVLEMLYPHPPAGFKDGGLLRPLAGRVLGCALAAQGLTAKAEAQLIPSLEALRVRHGDGSWEARQVQSCLDQARGAPASEL